MSFLPTEGEGGGETHVRQQEVQLWADGVMNASGRPRAENNNKNKNYNNDDDKVVAGDRGGEPNQHPSTWRTKQRHVPLCFFLLDFILSSTSRRFCTAGDVRNELQCPITHLTAEREITSRQFFLAIFFC